MKLLYRFDEEGYYTEPIFSHDVDRFNITFDRLTEIPPPDYVRAKFVNGQWTEGADNDYMESIKPLPMETPVDVMMEQNALLIMELAESRLQNEFLLGQQTELIRFIADKFDPSSPIAGDTPIETPPGEIPSQPPADEDTPSDGTPSEPNEDEQTDQPEYEEPTEPEPVEEGENG